MKRRPGLTLAEHRALGEWLSRTRDAVQHESVRVANAYGVSVGSPLYRHLDRAIKALDTARSAGENQCYRDAETRTNGWPEADRTAVLTGGGIRAYYGPWTPDGGAPAAEP